VVLDIDDLINIPFYNLLHERINQEAVRLRYMFRTLPVIFLHRSTHFEFSSGATFSLTDFYLQLCCLDSFTFGMLLLETL